MDPCNAENLVRKESRRRQHEREVVEKIAAAKAAAGVALVAAAEDMDVTLPNRSVVATETNLFWHVLNLFGQQYICIFECLMNLHCKIIVHGFVCTWVLRFGKCGCETGQMGTYSTLSVGV